MDMILPLSLIHLLISKHEILDIVYLINISQKKKHEIFQADMYAYKRRNVHNMNKQGSITRKCYNHRPQTCDKAK